MISTLHGGYYDGNRHAEFEAELAVISPHSDVVIDLASTEYLDAWCCSLLIRNLAKWREQKPGTQLRLMNVQPQLAGVLRSLELDRIFFIN
ncbi:MAG: STAS domain-containing protein [Vulcanimicrobiaceae bacterium]